MKIAVVYTALAIAVFGAALYLRLADLDNRPMHCDEAVHGIKFGRLLQQNDYVYDPREYHGPSLNYLTLPVAKCLSRSALTDVTESDLRLVPAITGVLLVVMVWCLRREVGTPVTLCAMALTALSPAMVFYSRYYIQEMVLVGFTFGAMVSVIRFRRIAARMQPWDETASPGRWRLFFWAVTFGVCIAMMHASKETSVIALFAMVVAAFVSFRKRPLLARRRVLQYAALATVVAVFVSALFFSSFGKNPRGVWDSVTTYFYYLGRASGEGSTGRHVYPLFYYFKHLFWYQRFGGPLWTELAIGVPALVGAVVALSGKGLGAIDQGTARFLAVYTLIMTVVYSVMPYKTPWCALGFFHGMILLAAIGKIAIVRITPHPGLKILVGALLAAACGQLAWQSWRASFEQYEHPGNPYVYSQTTNDIPRLANKIAAFATAQPDQWATHIQVICPDDDYWPLPWYLRRFRRVGWFHEVPTDRPAVLIITQPTYEPELLQYLYVDQPPGQRDLYGWFPTYDDDREVYLRAHVPLRIYVRLDEWNEYDR
jgi:uncharacterized protein (TIGR03663 family)